MVGGSVRGDCGFGDEQMDGFLPFLACLQPLDEAFVVGGGSVKGSGDEGLPDGYHAVSAAVDEGVAQSDAELRAHDGEFPAMGVYLDETEEVGSCGEHPVGGLDGVGVVVAVDVELAFGVEAVCGVAVECELFRFLFCH